MIGTIKKTDQYAFVAFVIDRSAVCGRAFSTKMLQKRVHFIQEFGGVDAGYRFQFYTYGPYSSYLAGDLKVVERSGGAEIKYNDAKSRYEIAPGRKIYRLVDLGLEFVRTNQVAIEKVSEAFGEQLARGNILYSTIAYLHGHAPAETFEDSGKLSTHLKCLNPKRSHAEIDEAIREVKEFLSGQM